MVEQTAPKEHHPNCYQSKGVPQSLIDVGAPASLCDCHIIRMIESGESASLCRCGHTKASHAPNECVGCTGLHCGDSHGGECWAELGFPCTCNEDGSVR